MSQDQRPARRRQLALERGEGAPDEDEQVLPVAAPGAAASARSTTFQSAPLLSASAFMCRMSAASRLRTSTSNRRPARVAARSRWRGSTIRARNAPSARRAGAAPRDGGRRRSPAWCRAAARRRSRRAAAASSPRRQCRGPARRQVGAAPLAASATQVEVRARCREQAVERGPAGQGLGLGVAREHALADLLDRQLGRAEERPVGQLEGALGRHAARVELQPARHGCAREAAAARRTRRAG